MLLGMLIPFQMPLQTRKRCNYSEDALQKALEEIRSGAPKKSTAKKYNIPRATLQFRLGDAFKKVSKGPSTILSKDEETKIVNWIVESQKKGFPKRKIDIQVSVQQFLNGSNKKIGLFKDNFPGCKWYKCFLRRHPILTQRKAEAVTAASASVSEQDIKKWFNDIYTYFQEKGIQDILQDPSRIFNGDETNFYYCPTDLGKVLAPKGTKNVYEVDQGDAKQNLTVMFTFAASGTVTPPMIIYPNKRLPQSVKDSVPEEWSYALTDNGWMKCETFLFYLEHVLYPSLLKDGTKFPIALFVDGHKTHVTYDVSKLCTRLQIVLVALYPNATRILQPADVGSFKPLKNLWRSGVLEWRRQHPFAKLGKPDFAPILKQAVDRLSKQSIANSFKACGIFPWNPNAVDYSKCLGKKKDSSVEETNEVPLIETEEKTLNFHGFKQLIGEEKCNELTKPNLAMDENLTLLKKVYNYFKDMDVESENIFSESFTVLANTNELTYTEEEIAGMPLVIDDGSLILKEIATMENNVSIEHVDYPGYDINSTMPENAFVLKQNETVKIDNFLQTAKTPERKGKRDIKRTSFVISSSGFKKQVEEKQEIKRQEELIKETKKQERLQKQAIKKQNKPNPRKNNKRKRDQEELKKENLVENKTNHSANNKGVRQLDLKKRKVNVKQGTDKEQQKEFNKIINKDIVQQKTDTQTDNIIIEKSKIDKREKETLADLDKTLSEDEEEGVSEVHNDQYFNSKNIFFKSPNDEVVISQQKTKTNTHVRNLFKSPAKLSFGSKTNITAEKGLCFICLYNLSQIRKGIRCQTCTRQYHILCLEEKRLYCEHFKCAACLSKTSHLDN